MKRDLYVIHDTERSGVRKVSETEASILNKEGFGVFWTVNEFDGPRKSENLVRLNSWYVEIDEIDKAIQIALIEQSPVPPNLVVESKNGFHIYWNCREATLQNYSNVLSGLRHYFLGDHRAKDVARLLRAPGYLHQKDPSDPFLVQVVWSFDGTYSEKLMLYNFPIPSDESDEITEPSPARVKMSFAGDDFWERVYNMDCEYALLRLSGTPYVNGEVYTFQRLPNGHLNIWVNGKPTSSFIDSRKKIGSLSGGGPSIWFWLKWFGRSNTETYRVLVEAFPELVK